MARYLSLDTEATGLEADCYLIQIALVPVDTTARRVEMHLAQETLVKCPSFEELKPRLNPWVLEHNESLIRDAHAQGVEPAGRVGPRAAPSSSAPPLGGAGSEGKSSRAKCRGEVRSWVEETNASRSADISSAVW